MTLPLVNVLMMLKRLIARAASLYTTQPPLLAKFLIIAVMVSLLPFQAFAQTKRSFIRDAEIENIIRAFSAPIFTAAGMEPSDVTIRLIQDKTLNAFVAGGRNIFLHTGLIIESTGPDSLIGVIAHETGHIEGGHLSRTRAAMEDASAIQLIGTILGTIAAVGSGDPRAAQAVIMGSASVSQRTFMKYSRTQESAADQAAMRLLDATERSAKGLEGFFSVLEGQEVLTKRLQDPYVQSHPISRTRVSTLRNFITTSPYSDKEASEADKLAFARMVAKLYGYLEPLQTVLKRYPESNQSFAARYARTIAYYRQPDLKRALVMVEDLMQDSPDDAYLYELKGQMLFEHGRLNDALVAYQKSYQLAPTEQLIVMELARAELETNNPDLLDSAIKHLRRSIHLGGHSSFTWRQLGIAYGRKGDMGLSSLALAESELRIGQLANAEFLATRALKQLKGNDSAFLQAQDIIQSIKTHRETKARKK